MHNRIASLFTLLALTPAVYAQATIGERTEVPGQVVVCFSSPDTNVDLGDIVQSWEQATPTSAFTIHSSRSIMQWQRRNEFEITNVVLLEYAPASMPSSVLQAWLKDAEGVRWVAPNTELQGDPREHTPNDPQYGNQYHHPLMQNNLAWDTTFGDPSIIVGVTDDGVDIGHQDLNANIWTNTGEIPGDGSDNDGNGYVDDVQGWDFAFGHNDPNPDGGNDHGTHVAGIVAADIDNNIGVVGVAGKSTIMPLQFYASGQSWTAAIIADAFAYGTDNGAHIITTSYNMDGWVGDPVVTAAFDYMYDNGVLHFNSAGNGNALNPPRQAFTQSMLVASTDSSDTRSSFSNYGTGIDIAAPGSSVLSTILNNGYGTKSGTSMAAPNAAGVAALIWSANPTWTSAQVAAQMSFTADNIDSQNPGYVGLLGGGRVNPFKALTQVLPSPRVTNAVGLPADGGALVGDLGAIQMRFDQILDPATVNQSGTFSLTYAGPDGAFGNGDDVVIALTADEYLFAGNEVTLNVTTALPAAGDYRFAASGTLLTNPFGAALDGNGDGTGGDDWNVTFSACATIVLVEDNAEVGTDWSVVNENLSTGAWTAIPVVPTGGGVRSDPPTDFDGSGKCFVTQDGPGDQDVDGGPTRLISRAFDLSSSADPYLSFARWLVTTGDDIMTVDISNDDGANWLPVANLTGTEDWKVETYRVADFVTPTATTRLRFSVEDNASAPSVTEGGIDYLRVIELDCNPGQPVGTSYCVGAPNSAGAGALLSGVGSAQVSANNLTLVTQGLPASVVGLYYFGPNQVQLPAGDGFRCVGGATFRFNPATAASPMGINSYQVDLTAAPAVGVINAGSVFNFQHWYRDVAAGGAGFNFSDGLTIFFL